MVRNETLVTDTGAPTQMTWLQILLRRRRFLICPSLQLPLLLATFGHILIVAAALAAGLFGPSILSLLSSDATSERALAAAGEILYLHARFWPVLALSFLFVALDSIRISHKIAGPLFRFDRALDRIRHQRVPGPIRLRRDDLLQEDCRRINDVLDLTRCYLREVRDAREQLSRSIEDARHLEPGRSPEELEQRLSDLVDQAERLAQLSGRFELDRESPES